MRGQGRAARLVASCLVAVALGSAAGWAQSPSRVPESGREAAVASVRQALARQDHAGALAAERGWAQAHPADLDARRLEPWLFALNKDSAGWERARGDLLRTWQGVRGRGVAPSPPRFMVDVFDAGGDRVIAEQCYERAGRFGVIYRFLVLAPGGALTSYFTVESPESDNQIARELGNPSPVFTLDHFTPGQHATVGFLPGLPAYAEIRRRVLTYLANPRPQSSSGTGSGGLANVDCVVGAPG